MKCNRATILTSFRAFHNLLILVFRVSIITTVLVDFFLFKYIHFDNGLPYLESVTTVIPHVIQTFYARIVNLAIVVSLKNSNAL